MSQQVLDTGLLAAAEDAIAKHGLPDLVHVQDSKGVSAALKLKDELGIPLVSTVHSTETLRRLGRLEDQHYAQEWSRRVMIEASDLVICVSEYLYKFITYVFGVESRKLRVIPNGIDPRAPMRYQAKRLAEEAVSRTEGRTVLLYAGRLAPEKGVSALLEALYILVNERGRRDLWLYLAGEGNMRESIAARIDDLGLKDNVYLAGNQSREALATQYRSSDLIVIPSLYDSFPITALEAMAAAKPVLAAAVGGIPELIRHRETGFLSYAITPRDWANSIEDTLSRPGLMRECAQRGRGAILSKYNHMTMARETSSVYREALQLPEVRSSHEWKKSVI